MLILAVFNADCAGLEARWGIVMLWTKQSLQCLNAEGGRLLQSGWGTLLGDRLVDFQWGESKFSEGKKSAKFVLDPNPIIFV